MPELQAVMGQEGASLLRVGGGLFPAGEEVEAEAQGAAEGRRGPALGPSPLQAVAALATPEELQALMVSEAAALQVSGAGGGGGAVGSSGRGVELAVGDGR